MVAYAFYIIDPYRTGRVEKNDLKHFLEAIWDHSAPITLQEALAYLDDRDENHTQIYTLNQVRTIVKKYPNIMYPVYKLQIHMIENTLGQFWWDNHRAAMLEAREQEKQREIDEMERRRRNEDLDDDAAAMRSVSNTTLCHG